MKTYLKREVDRFHIRYYNLEIFQTLFGEFLLEITYGNVNYKSHTGKRQYYFAKLAEAQAVFEAKANKTKKQRVLLDFL